MGTIGLALDEGLANEQDQVPPPPPLLPCSLLPPLLKGHMHFPVSSSPGLLPSCGPCAVHCVLRRALASVGAGDGRRTHGPRSSGLHPCSYPCPLPSAFLGSSATIPFPCAPGGSRFIKDTAVQKLMKVPPTPRALFRSLVGLRKGPGLPPAGGGSPGSLAPSPPSLPPLPCVSGTVTRALTQAIAAVAATARSLGQGRGVFA